MNFVTAKEYFRDHDWSGEGTEEEVAKWFSGTNSGPEIQGVGLRQRVSAQREWNGADDIGDSALIESCV